MNHTRVKAIVVFLFLIHSYAISNPKLSIIVSLFERAELIDPLLKELSLQTIFPISEIIVVAPENFDKKIVQSLAGRYHQMRIFYLPVTADEVDILNIAIKNARGEFLIVTQAGDLHQKDAFERRVFALESDKNIDLVYADFWWNYEPFKNAVKSCDVMRLPEFSPYFFAPCLPCAKSMWRKSIHDRFGLFTHEYSTKNMWAFWRKLICSGVQCKKITTPDFIHFIDTKAIVSGNLSLVSQELLDEQAIIKDYPLPVFAVEHEKPFVIIIPSYNNERWYQRNLHSIFMQNYNNYRIIYIDDASHDKTLELVEEYIMASGQEHRTTMVKNTKRTGRALGNICNALATCKPEEIAVILDGDDWFAHENVLAYLHYVYQDSNVWMTYGQFSLYPHQVTGWAEQVPAEVIKKNSIRDHSWCTTHLRTFYVWLYQHIQKESLLFEGDWFAMAGDIALMLSLTELAGTHSKFIDEILYVYNRTNPINADKVNRELQLRCEKAVRSGKRYDPL